MSHYQWVRKFLGGKWAKDKREGYLWVSWQESNSRLQAGLDMIGWPLNPEEYICEEWS